MTIPPDAGAKFHQDLLFGSPEWHAMYSTLRNSIEGFNGVREGQRHRGPSVTPSDGVCEVWLPSVLVAFLLFAANLRKIDAFQREVAAVEAGAVTRLSRRRQTKALGAWRPRASSDESVSSPDSPLTA